MITAMAKTRHLSVKLDDDLARLMDEAAAKFQRSRAEILSCGLMLFGELSEGERREALMRYVTRELAAGASAAEGAGSEQQRSRPMRLEKNPQPPKGVKGKRAR